MKTLLGTIAEPSLMTVLSAPIFLVLFIGIIWFVYRKDKKEQYERYSEIPLESDK